MPNAKDCSVLIQRALKDKLDPAILEEISIEVDEKIRAMSAAGIKDPEALRGYIETRIQERHEAALLEEAQHIFQASRETANLDKIATFKAQGLAPDKSVSARLVGEETEINETLDSVDAYVVAKGTEANGVFGKEFHDDPRELAFFRGGMKHVNDEAILHGLYYLDGMEKAPPKSKMALAIAKKAMRLMEADRNLLNSKFAGVRKIKAYWSLQYDPIKMYKLGFDQFSALVENTWDIDRAMSAFARTRDYASPESYKKFKREFILGMWNNVMSDTRKEFMPPPGDPIKREARTLADRVSSMRISAFKDATSEMKFRRAVSGSGLYDDLQAYHTSAYKNYAVLSEFGPNPKQTFDKIMQAEANAAHDKGDAKLAAKFIIMPNRNNKILNQFNQIIGLPSDHSHPRRAWAFNLAKVNKRMSALGLALFSNQNDLPGIALTSKQHGMPAMKPFYEAAKFAGMRIKKGDVEMKKSARAVLVVLESELYGNTARHFADDIVSGMVSRAEAYFFQATGLEGHRKLHQAGFSLANAINMAELSHLEYGKLNPYKRNIFSKYGIESEEWDAIRAMEVTDTGLEDSTKMITAHEVPSIPKKFIDVVAKKHNISEGEAMELLSRKLSIFLVNEMNQALLTPGAKERATMFRSYPAGTWERQALEMFWMFKSYAVTYKNRIWGRMMHGRTVGMSDYMVFGGYLAASLMTGYATLVLADAIKGLTPRRFNTIEVMLKAGTGGTYADFVLADVNRYGAGALEVFGGPMLGDAFTMAQVAAHPFRIFRDDAEPESVGRAMLRQSYRVALRNTPFINMHMGRMVVDYVGLHDLTETVAPGTTRRMVESAKKRKQRYYINPNASLWR